MIRTRSQWQQAFVQGGPEGDTGSPGWQKGKPGSVTPVFAHMARQMTSFSFLF
jgi:hypothetical protein